MMIVILVILGIAVLYGPSVCAQYILNKYNHKEYFSGNGIELARLALDRIGLNHVMVEETQIGDHYDPISKTVRLTQKMCGKRTLTSVVVAAHEVGHAIQDHLNYMPLKTRTRMIGKAARLEKAGIRIMIVVPILAMMTRVPAVGLLMFLGGFATLCIPVIMHLLTLPVEFNASFKCALPLLSTEKLIPEEDFPAAKRILLACALTYAANAFAGLLNVWRWLRVLRR